jgi:hypothetical protein
MYNFTNTINQALTHSKLERLAPSIFSAQAKDTLTNRYNFIPTIQVVKEMEHQGWLPVKAMESRTRDEMNQGYQKHMVRFRNFNEQITDKLAVGDTFVELVLTNSHNGLSSFVFNCGLYRLACNNGMVISENSFNSAHIRHNSYNAKEVIDICSETVRKAPQITGRIEDMKAIELTPQEQFIFANAAKPLRFNKPEEIDTEKILLPQRMSDKGNDLWTVYNRLQENLIKGNVRYDRRDANGRYKGRGHTREVKAINANLKLNQALWTLTEEMAKLKTDTTLKTLAS